MTDKVIEVFVYFLQVQSPIIWTLRSNDADGSENVKKTIGFISKTTALHVYHTFFGTFLSCFCTTTR